MIDIVGFIAFMFFSFVSGLIIGGFFRIKEISELICRLQNDLDKSNSSIKRINDILHEED